jgi:hypothetical protein
MASFVYYMASVLFPAYETILQKAIFEDAEMAKSDRSHSGNIGNGTSTADEKAGVQNTETLV